MVSRDDEQRPLERAQERRRARVLLRPVAVSEVTARDDELGIELADERAQGALDLRLLRRAGVQVGNVKNPHRPHLGLRLQCWYG